MKTNSSTASTSSISPRKDEDKDSGICSLYCLASCLTPTSASNDTEISNLLAGTSTIEPFLRKGLFSNMPCTINFYTKGHKVKKPSEYYLSKLAWCHNSLLPLVMRQSLTTSHFKIVDEKKAWIGYWGRHLKSLQYQRIKPYQKVNHFPGAFHLGRKDRLWQHLFELMNDDEKFSIMPYTYILPKDAKRLKAYLSFPTVRHVIVKPPASARGSGINIVSRFKHIPQKTLLVAQHYIEKPFLINGSKFDLRLYVYVTNLEPLRIYMYDDGLVRFASVPYSTSLSSYTNQYMHLTNYSINRLSQENGMADEPVQKWTLNQFWEYLAQEGYDASALKLDIQNVAIKAIIACEYHIRQHQSTYSEFPFISHELFGMDILIDSTLRPWLLEMNISPSLQSSTPVDIGVKARLACDVLNMCGLTFPPEYDNFENSLAFRIKPYRKDENHLKKEITYIKHFKNAGVTREDIILQLTNTDLRYLIDFESEYSRRGGFELIYPQHTNSEEYLANMRSPVYANLLLSKWQKFQGTDRQRGISILENMCFNRAHIVKSFSICKNYNDDDEKVDEKMLTRDLLDKRSCDEALSYDQNSEINE